MKYIAKLAFVFAAVSLSAFATETENVRFRIIKAPGAVNVDANSSDWDLSGSIFCCLGFGGRQKWSEGFKVESSKY